MSGQQARTIVVALMTALLAIILLGGMTFYVKGIECQVDLALSYRGETKIEVPPVGSISARTHWTPVKIILRLENIDLDILRQLLKEAPSPAELEAQIREDLRNTARNYFFRLLLLGMLGGLAGAVIVAGAGKRAAWHAATAGLCITLLLFGLTIGTYRAEKLRSPEYHGALKAAPWAIGLAETAFKKINVLGTQMQVVAANLENIFDSIDNIAALNQEKADLLVLHVSDIHNNPVAHKFLMQIAGSFPIDIVIDTGDITDFGTPLEGELLKGLMDLQVPYLFVPGNHDSPEVVKEMSGYPQVQVLTGGIVDVQGLRVLGQADPSSYSREISSPAPDELEKSKEQLARLWEVAVAKPHLIAVHNIAAAENMVGKAPLIIYGHTHQPSIKTVKDTVMINAGTSGAAGLRGLQAAQEIPYSVALLRFRKDRQDELHLTAVDTIKLYNIDRGFTLERKLFAPPSQQ